LPRHINLRQIEAFKAVVENGTVSRAAELLNVSQPAMSKLIAHLEFDTGLKLFDRLKGRLAPTAQGMRLYDEVGRIFAGVRQVENAVEVIRREEQGRLSIGVMPALAGSFIQRSTKSFLDDHQNVFCTVQSLGSQWIMEWLIERKLDIGLVEAGLENPYVVGEPLMKHPLVCIMAPDHPLAAEPFIPRCVMTPRRMRSTRTGASPVLTTWPPSMTTTARLARVAATMAETTRRKSRATRMSGRASPTWPQVTSSSSTGGPSAATAAPASAVSRSTASTRTTHPSG